MKVLRLYEQGPAEDQRLHLQNISAPEPGWGEILVQISHCGVCHTDLHIVEGDIHPPSLPIIPGHQVVGKVIKVGGGVDQLQSGQRVGIPWLYSACGECEYCRRGEENLCAQAKFTGFHVNGGFATKIIAEARFALPLPHTIRDDQAAPLLCAGIIGYRSLIKADVQPGERLGLIGFGASAHLAIQIAESWGCPVYVFTRSETHREHARQLGATWVGGIEQQAPEALDRAVLFAPSGKLVPLILEKLRPGGTLAINAIHLTPIPTLPYDLIYGERTLRSVANATYRDGMEFLRLAAEIPVRATVNLYPMNQANQALIDLKNSRINGEAVLVMD
jgi:propanol-preferring alcohol dehydrogenase